MYKFIINPYNIKNYVINMNGGVGILDNALSLFGLNDIDMFQIILEI